VALVRRIDKIIGLFCKRALQKRQYSAKETYNFIDPTNRSHPIAIMSELSSNLTFASSISPATVCRSAASKLKILKHYACSPFAQVN